MAELFQTEDKENNPATPKKQEGLMSEYKRSICLSAERKRTIEAHPAGKQVGRPRTRQEESPLFDRGAPQQNLSLPSYQRLDQRQLEVSGME